MINDACTKPLKNKKEEKEEEEKKELLMFSHNMCMFLDHISIPKVCVYCTSGNKVVPILTRSVNLSSPMRLFFYDMTYNAFITTAHEIGQM
ncbi:hypothetical protein PoB_003235200 [Plakobranchus ocellatus]|uniref:Uncharacterized protein n=1 Tax=Plakobranchus ocellatus TaxID=259542 RepID=A0AAV4AG18_9GAST|nr:hypothetical protein PoB_003235200 [Plakobranchus ocellatus]